MVERAKKEATGRQDEPLLPLAANVRDKLGKYPRSLHCNKLLDPSVLDKENFHSVRLRRERNGMKRTPLHDLSTRQGDQKLLLELWISP